MKTWTKIGILALSTMVLTACGDSDSSNNTQASNGNSLKSLSRSVIFLTDTNKMSLYTFDKDNLNQSNCDEACQKLWPLFRGADSTSEDIKVIKGSDHLAYRNHPLYFFANDKAIGDINGDNVKNVWHLVHAPSSSNETHVEFSETMVTQTYLTDGEGRALYTFDKDTTGVSNCYGGCEETWPVYHVGTIDNVPEGLNKSDFTTISRDVNKSTTAMLSQTAYQGKPLYYFTPDNKKSGATKGDWVKGVWHLVELSAKKQ